MAAKVNGKTNGGIADVEEKERRYCHPCKKNKRLENDFYESRNPLSSIDGKMVICKVCTRKLFKNDIESMIRILRIIDKPFKKEVWDQAYNHEDETFGTYIRLLNGTQHLKDATFDDSDDFTKRSDVDSMKNASIDNDELSEKWGIGWTNEEYLAFERKHSRLRKSYDEKTEMHSEALRTYIIYKVKAELETAKGNVKEAKDWGSLAQKAADDAKLNPKQMNKSDLSGGIDAFSQLFEAVESEASIIPLLPQVLEAPYDDADMIIWSTINYGRKLEEKPRVSYREVWNFYDGMINEFCIQKGMTEKEIAEFKEKRNNVFRDLEKIYIEPLYEEDDEEENTEDVGVKPDEE